MISLYDFSRRLAKDAYEQVIRWRIPRISPTVVRTFSHDPTAFTQGLAIHEGKLYESTGIFGSRKSTLREVCMETGRVNRRLIIEDDFSEGIACNGDQIAQLSWRAGVVRTYRLADFEPLKRHTYRGEGWGLTRHPEGYAMSAGGSTIFLRDREFNLAGTLSVVSNGLPLRRINDIEYLGDCFLANVWFSSDIFVISGITGKVTGIIDCSAIVAPEYAAAGSDGVLNGIAYNSENGTVLITGKLWRHMYEIDCRSLRTVVEPHLQA